MHLRNDTFHYFDWARSARHDAGAQGRKVEFRKTRMVQFSDEHGWNAMQRGAALPGDRFEGGNRTEVRRRKHHGRAMRYTGQVSQHHPKTVVKGHRDAEAIVTGQSHAFPNPEPIVEDVVVRKHGALWETGCA